MEKKVRIICAIIAICLMGAYIATETTSILMVGLGFGLVAVDPLKDTK